MTEIWKPVVGYEGLYAVSDRGHVRRVAQYRNSTEKPLKASIVAGYPRITLCKDNVRRAALVHRVVAEAFIGMGPNMVINHKNGNKTDNRLSNLEVCTRSENERHKWHTLKRGVLNNVKITRKIADQIRALYGPEWSYSKLGKRFGLHKSTIADIISMRIWNT